METLKLGQTLETREAQVLLDPALRPGKYRMQLRVIGPAGESDPAELRIVVRERIVEDPRVPVPPVIRGVAPLSLAATVPKPKAKPKPKQKQKPPGKPKRK